MTYTADHIKTCQDEDLPEIAARLMGWEDAYQGTAFRTMESPDGERFVRIYRDGRESRDGFRPHRDLNHAAVVRDACERCLFAEMLVDVLDLDPAPYPNEVGSSVEIAVNMTAFATPAQITRAACLALLEMQA